MQQKKQKQIRKLLSVLALALFALSMITTVAEAAAAGGGMPWESGLDTLKASLSGPVAQAIGLIALVAAGAALIFGGDMTGFMRTCVYVVLVLGLLLCATSLLSALYPS
jgi:type IV secretion system protein VirB2